MGNHNHCCELTVGDVDQGGECTVNARGNHNVQVAVEVIECTGQRLGRQVEGSRCNAQGPVVKVSAHLACRWSFTRGGCDEVPRNFQVPVNLISQFTPSHQERR
jgi:hypothetical protein